MNVCVEIYVSCFVNFRILLNIYDLIIWKFLLSLIFIYEFFLANKFQIFSSELESRAIE